MCTSYRLWELEYGTDLWLEQSSLGKLLWNVYTILYMYLQAHVLPTNKSSLFMFIITSIPCIVLKIFFLTLRMVLYKKDNRLCASSSAVQVRSSNIENITVITTFSVTPISVQAPPNHSAVSPRAWYAALYST